MRSHKELRTGTTSTPAAGFTTPYYAVQSTALARTGQAVFLSQANHQTSPQYGLTVYLFRFTGPTQFANQTENAGVTKLDPTSSYLQANLVTIASQTTVSQQLIDRAGPIGWDGLLTQQLHRDFLRAG